MNVSVLTPEQRPCFDENGYVIVRNALTPPVLERVTAAVDRLFEEGLREGRLNRASAFELRNAIVHDDAFLNLLDWPATVPLAVQLLGWDIQLDTSHVIVRPPQLPGTSAHFKALDWHRDGGIAKHELPAPQPRLRLKICYVLSDMSQSGRGNIHIIPGSRRLLGKPAWDEGGIDPMGAMELLAVPGAAFLFEYWLYHAVGPKLSDITRKTVFIGYSYCWLRLLDDVVQPPALEEKVQQDPIRWQLLGFWSSTMAFSLPQDEDVPLRAWCREHGVEVPGLRP